MAPLHISTTQHTWSADIDIFSYRLRGWIFICDHEGCEVLSREHGRIMLHWSSWEGSIATTIALSERKTGKQPEKYFWHPSWGWFLGDGIRFSFSGESHHPPKMHGDLLGVGVYHTHRHCAFPRRAGRYFYLPLLPQKRLVPGPNTAGSSSGPIYMIIIGIDTKPLDNNLHMH